MEGEPATRPCPNCKKDIPAENFTLHSVHCARNLRVCRQCNEPIAICDMEKHTAQVSCNLCGETMQACDLPPHKSDACSRTQIPCQYCELMLERAAMAEHEAYCGTRTEKCEECSELVMFKYKKLHEDSNHVFIKLSDEPGPAPSWEAKPEKTKKHSANSNKYDDKHKNEAKNNHSRLKNVNAVNFNFESGNLAANADPVSIFNKNHDKITSPSTSRGAIKKRIAPQPPVQRNSESRNGKSHRALKPLPHLVEPNTPERQNDILPLPNHIDRSNDRHSVEVRKVHKHKPNADNKRYLAFPEEAMSSGSTSKSDDSSSSKNVNLKTDKNNKKKYEYLEYSPELGFAAPANFGARNQPIVHNSEIASPRRNEAQGNIQEKNIRKASSNPIASGKTPKVLQNPALMASNQNAINHNANGPNQPDRFSDIKNNLTALRKEFKNCTSPYENKNLAAKKEEKVFTKVIAPANLPANDNDFVDVNNPVHLYKLSNDLPINENGVDDNYALNDVMLPCEFCEEMINASELVMHETGCRPQLTSYVKNMNTDKHTTSNDPNPPAEHSIVKFANTIPANSSVQPAHSPRKKKNKNQSNLLNSLNDVQLLDEMDEAKLPCEFCFKLVPASRLQWHQQMCLVDMAAY